MKRLHLFEFEDFRWFPDWLRDCMTSYINAVHRLLGSSHQIAEILAGLLTIIDERRFFDFCSGSGGPMPEVISLLRENYGFENVTLTLSDLNPNTDMARIINSKGDRTVHYRNITTNVEDVDFDPPGIRTLICSLHHMPPETATAILGNAHHHKKPIFIYEISDNSFPRWLWWIAIPANIISVLIITPMVRPMSWQQLVFTYLIPVLPLVISWDGAVSNARTYTLDDLDVLLEGLYTADYQWEKGSVKGRGSDKLYLIGCPQSEKPTWDIS